MYSEPIDDKRNKAAISFCDIYQSGIYAPNIDLPFF